MSPTTSAPNTSISLHLKDETGISIDGKSGANFSPMALSVNSTYIGMRPIKELKSTINE